MSATEANDVVYHYDNTLGALLVGGMLSTALWGVTTVQTHSFFWKGSRDRQTFKVLIAFLWGLDTFDTSLIFHFLYHHLVVNYANQTAIAYLVWSIVAHTGVTSVSNFTIRTMFTRRVYRLSNKNFTLSFILFSMSLVDLVVGIIITAKCSRLTLYSELGSTVSKLFYINFAAGTGADLFLAAALCFYLYKSRTGFKRTDSIIGTLLLYTINTSLLVAVDASLGMFLYIGMPDNFIFMAPYLLLSKLYLNSYLASLNARDGIRNQTQSVSIPLSQIFGSRTDEESVSPTAIPSEKSRSELLASSSKATVTIDSSKATVTVDSSAQMTEPEGVVDGVWHAK